jgi:hypothetical protein
MQAELGINMLAPVYQMHLGLDNTRDEFEHLPDSCTSN